MILKYKFYFINKQQMLLIETIPPGGGILFTNSQLVKTIPSPLQKIR